MSTENIKVQDGIFIRTLTATEISTLLADVTFLSDAILYLLNPVVCEDSDLPYTSKEEVIKHLKEYYSKTSYSKEFISEIFHPEKTSKNKNFTPVFKVFKEGTTTQGPVTIMKENGRTYNTEAKIKFYQELGYTVTRI